MLVKVLLIEESSSVAVTKMKINTSWLGRVKVAVKKVLVAEVSKVDLKRTRVSWFTRNSQDSRKMWWADKEEFSHKISLKIIIPNFLAARGVVKWPLEVNVSRIRQQVWPTRRTSRSAWITCRTKSGNCTRVTNKRRQLSSISYSSKSKDLEGQIISLMGAKWARKCQGLRLKRALDRKKIARDQKRPTFLRQPKVVHCVADNQPR